VIADHDVDLVRLAAERDLRDRTAPVETFEARTAHGTQRFEGCTTGFEWPPPEVAVFQATMTTTAPPGGIE
jgi:hypothetical protein